MVVYSIYNVCLGNRPYYGVSYTSFEECREALYNIIEYHKKRNHVYYVDNDFFKNDYPYFMGHCYYFSIHSRTVTEWQKVYVKQDIIKNNIINFTNYLDKY